MTGSNLLHNVTLRAPGNIKLMLWCMLTKQLRKTPLSQWVHHCHWNRGHSSRNHYGFVLGHLPHTPSWAMLEYAKVSSWSKNQFLCNTSIKSPFNTINIHSCIKLLHVFVHWWNLWLHFLNIYVIKVVHKIMLYKITTLLIMFESFVDEYCYIDYQTIESPFDNSNIYTVVLL